MTPPLTYTGSSTYTDTDIATVVRRFEADLVMIAQSSGAITEQEARDYSHDAEVFAKYRFLEMVDVTLLYNNSEIRAVQYTINPTSGDLTSSRPGGVRWPRVSSPILRIFFRTTNAYDAAAEEAIKRKLKCNWSPTSINTDHLSLRTSGGRDYVSNGWGMQRKDFLV